MGKTIRALVLGVCLAVGAIAADKLDLNTAAPSAIATVIGVDGATAAKIVASRPYASKSQLVSRKLLTKEQYERVKDLIVARQPKK